MDRAVILARGLGNRMRKADQDTTLNDQQAAMADTGIKAMIPTLGRPFLDFVLSTLADAGYQRICLVIGPEHDRIRDYYGKEVKAKRLSFEFAVQSLPKGTADAVLAAENVVGVDPFLMINSDNYYPLIALKFLRQLSEPALAVFDRHAMVEGSNIPADRIDKFALAQSDSTGYLQRIVEKPDAITLASFPEPVGVSMNCWRFSPAIFTACRMIKPSVRGEYEITDAVQYAINEMDEKFKVCHFKAPVLDMSSRGDIAKVQKRLAGVEVSL